MRPLLTTPVLASPMVAALLLLFLAGAMAVGAMTAEAAPAARAANAEPREEILEEVMVVSRRHTPLQYAAATVTVIDRQDIQRSLTADIRDLVRYEPGVTVRNDPVRFGIDSFAIRGIGGDRIVAQIDGVSVAQSFTVGALASSGRIYTDPDFMRRVEILRGPLLPSMAAMPSVASYIYRRSILVTCCRPRTR